MLFRSIAKLPKWKEVGVDLARALDEISAMYSYTMDKLHDAIAKGTEFEPDPKEISQMKSILCCSLGIDLQLVEEPDQLQCKILK